MADVFIFNVIVTRYAIFPKQHPCPYYREAPFIIFHSRPPLRTIEENTENDTAVSLGYETFVEPSITKNTSCGRRFIRIELIRQKIL